MAMVALKIPYDVASILEGVGPPGDNHAASDMHVTILYLGDDVNIPRLGLAMVAVQKVAAETESFLLSVNRVDSFPENNGSIPIIAPIDSPPLHKFHDALRSSMDECGVWYSTKWKEYKPHVTLSYAKDVDFKNASLNFPITWGVCEVNIYGGNEMGDGVNVTIPFKRNIISVATKVALKAP